MCTYMFAHGYLHCVGIGAHVYSCVYTGVASYIRLEVRLQVYPKHALTDSFYSPQAQARIPEY